MQQYRLRPFAAENLARTIAVGLTAAAIALLWGDVLLGALRILFGACVLSFLLSPVAALLEKKLKRPLAALIALVGVIVLLLLALGVLLPLLSRQAAGLMQTLPEAFDRLRTLAESILAKLQALIPGLTLPKLDLRAAESGFGDVARSAIGYVSNVSNAVYQLSLMVVLCYFLLADRDRILLRTELLVPQQWRRSAVRMGKLLMRELRLYLRGQATIALAVGILATVGFLLIGVPAAPLLGAIVGLLNVIPYLGPVLGGVPAVILALGVSWQRAALALLVLFLVQQIDGMVISPRVMGNITGFSPAVVLPALFLGSRMGGVWGMLLSMPALMAIRTVYRVFVQRHENN